MEKLTRFQSRFDLPVLLWLAVIGTVLVGCEALRIMPPKPVKPSEPSLDESGGTLFVQWENKTDYDTVEVRILRKDGDEAKVIKAPTKKGLAEVSLKKASAGLYEVRIVTNVRKGDSRGEAVSGPAQIEIRELVEIITRTHLGRNESEDLEVLFLIHPDCPFASTNSETSSLIDDSQRSVFRSVTGNVLRVVFPNPEEIGGENELLDIESQRDFLLGQGQKLHRDPDALVIIDFRVPTSDSEIPGQLHLRILDLKLARKLSLSYKDLFHRRALVVEGFQEVEEMAPRVFRQELIMSWKRLLREVLDDSRYRDYRRAISVLNDQLKDDETIEDRISGAADAKTREGLELVRDALRLRFFGDVAAAMRPYTDSEGAEERIARLEWGQLFSREYVSDSGEQVVERSEESTDPGEESTDPGEESGAERTIDDSDDSEKSASPPGATVERSEADSDEFEPLRESVRKDDGGY